MKKRHINILLFSLLAAIACNNVKASEQESAKSLEEIRDLLEKITQTSDGTIDPLKAVKPLEVTSPEMIQLFGREKLKEIFDPNNDEKQFKESTFAAVDFLLSAICPNMNEDERRTFLENIYNRARENIYNRARENISE